MASGTCTFSGHLPRLRLAALPPHVYALLTTLAHDREADEKLRVHAERCWHDRAERRESAELTAQQTLGLRGLGSYLEGSIGPTWTVASGWLEVSDRIMWAHWWKRGQRFETLDRRYRATLTGSQVRHVKTAAPRARALLERDRASTEELGAFDSWIAEKDPVPQGRKSLFTPDWWEYAVWVYRHYGWRHEPNTEIAQRASRDDDYISRKQGEFLKAGHLVGIRPPRKSTIALR